MKKRRHFLKLSLKVLLGLGLFFNPLFGTLRWGYGAARKRILPKGTGRESLIRENPASLDTRNLELTPLKEFGTMGPTDHEVDLDTWRLEISGAVRGPLRLKYLELLEMPSIERDVLLICPGFFANHGRWKGLSIQTLLQKAGVKEGAKSVTVHGPLISYEKVKGFPMEDVLSDQVFLAYQVNGEILPQRHGFPLRVVARGYYGYDWIKYVQKITVE